MKKEDMDQLVLSLLKKVEEKKAAIAKAKQKPQWKTNCVWKSENGTNVNIQVQNDIAILVALSGYLYRLTSDIEAGAKLIGVDLDDKGKEINGFSVDDWISDIKTRVSMLNVAKQEKELAELDKRVNKLVTPEQRRAMELEALKDLLN